MGGAKPTPKLTIDRETFDRLILYAKLSDTEISGFGIVRNMKVVKLLPLQPQICSSGETEITPETKVALHESLKKSGSTFYNLWWHKHPNSLFWSNQDEEAIELLGVHRTDLIYSIELNSEGQYICRIDQFDPFRYTWDGELIVETNYNSNLIQQIKEEIRQKVTVRKILMPTVKLPGDNDDYPLFDNRRWYDII